MVEAFNFADSKDIFFVITLFAIKKAASGLHWCIC